MNLPNSSESCTAVTTFLVSRVLLRAFLSISWAKGPSLCKLQSAKRSNRADVARAVCTVLQSLKELIDRLGRQQCPWIGMHDHHHSARDSLLKPHKHFDPPRCHRQRQVLLWNYPGQAFSEWREQQLLNNEYLSTILQYLLLHLGRKSAGGTGAWCVAKSRLDRALTMVALSVAVALHTCGTTRLHEHSQIMQ